jgi:hypothetical protein
LLYAAPNSILFRIQRVEGKGMGVIAARDVYAGELIMNEKPLLSLATEENAGGKPSKDDYKRVLQVVQDKVQGLSLREQERFYALSGYVRDTFDNDDDEEELPCRCECALTSSSTSSLSSSNDVLDDDAPAFKTFFPDTALAASAAPERMPLCIDARGSC